MIDWLQENPATVAACLSAVAALLSVIATWQGPRSAAKLSEAIRRKSESENDKRRMKLQVFSVLMQERATIASPDSVRMLNSIDFVFSDAPGVREAWAELFSIFTGSDAPHPQLQQEKLRILLKEMGKNIGLSSDLKVDDISRIYYPNALAQEEELQILRRQQALMQMRSAGQQQLNTVRVDDKILAKFPPRPNKD